MKKKSIIIALIVLLSVGFAAVSTTLFINGSALFGTNNDDFDVIFTKAIVDGTNKSYDVISEDGKTITYETKDLAIVGDESKLEFTVKNNSTQYDAEIEINCIGGNSLGTYYEITKTLPTEVGAQEKVEGNVVVTMIKSSVEEITEELTCTLNVTAVERNEEAELVPELETEITWSDEDSSGTRTVGDIVTISKEGESSEQFYILSSDETSTKMMSMYNLYVGGESNWSTDTYIPYENPTGIQDSTMIGYTTAGSPFNGTEVFSYTSSEYSGSVAEGYVNNYKDYLRNVLGVENSATLISKEELEVIVGSTLPESNGNLSTLGAPAFLYSTSYWTRSVHSTVDNCVLYVNANGVFHNHHFDDSTYLGIRPVVTIDTGLFDDEVIPQSIACEGICSDQDSNGIVTVGDIITLGDDTTESKEQFYVTSVSEDLSSVSMLSMYNLYVGGEWDGTAITAYTNSTGIQDSTMVGFVSGQTVRKGVTVFSSDEQKGTNYNDYTGSIVEGYVNNYSLYLTNTLGVANTSTLITVDELVDLGCDNISTNMCTDAPSWVYGMSYWTRTTIDTNSLRSVLSDGGFTTITYANSNYFGVRPLVTISADLI